MGEAARAPGAKWQLSGFVIAIACSGTDLRRHLDGRVDYLLEQASRNKARYVQLQLQ